MVPPATEKGRSLIVDDKFDTHFLEGHIFSPDHLFRVADGRAAIPEIS